MLREHRVSPLRVVVRPLDAVDSFVRGLAALALLVDQVPELVHDIGAGGAAGLIVGGGSVRGRRVFAVGVVEGVDGVVGVGVCGGVGGHGEVVGVSWVCGVI